MLVRAKYPLGLWEKPYSCYDLAQLSFSLLFSWMQSLPTLHELFFFLYLLLLREVGIGGLELYPKVVTLVIFFWDTGEFKDYLFLDYPFFFDLDFLFCDFPKLFPLLTFLCFWESAIILHFCLTDIFSWDTLELLIFCLDFLRV